MTEEEQGLPEQPQALSAEGNSPAQQPEESVRGEESVQTEQTALPAEQPARQESVHKEERSQPDLPQEAPPAQKPGPGAAATFWLLVLYDFPGIGLIASALMGFLFAKTRASRSLARACFARGVIALVIAGVLVGGYFFLRSRFALSNFLERVLQDALNFVRSNSDKL